MSWWDCCTQYDPIYVAPFPLQNRLWKVLDDCEGSQVGVDDTFWLFIFTLNRAKKWFNSIFNSKLNRKYSFNKLFIQYLVGNINSKFYSKIEENPIQIYVIFKPWVKACKKRKRERYLRTWGLQGTFLTYWVPIYHILGSFMWERKIANYS